MNDQAPHSSQPSRRTPPPKQGLSYESRFIGYLVLGFGVLAVIAVAIIAFSAKKETGSKQTAQEPVQQATQPPQALVSDMINTQPIAPEKPKPELFFEREPDLDAEDLKGAWQTSIGKYTAVVQFKKDVYQIILAQPDPNAARLYSSGTYKVMEDIILLTPHLDWPQPATQAGKTIAYEILTRAPFPIIAVIDGNKMLWQNPPQSESRVLVPYKTPLFLDEKVDYATWKKLD